MKITNKNRLSPEEIKHFVNSLEFIGPDELTEGAEDKDTLYLVDTSKPIDYDGLFGSDIKLIKVDKNGNPIK